MRGDFTGFTFDGIHSEDLGITRVSGGDRYDDTLLPELEDKTVDIPGNDGQYYFNSDFRQKNFTIEVAFDSLTEEQLRRLRSVFSTKEIVPLIFDEKPYITYFGKVSSPPEFHYICFEENLTGTGTSSIIKKSEKFPVLFPEGIETQIQDTEYIEIKYKKKRIYKGEGSINFTCYFPFGRCINKYLDLYSEEDYPNKNEWAAASQLLETNKYNIEGQNVDIDTYIIKQNAVNRFYVYNPGDRETPPLIYIPFKDGKIKPTIIEIEGSLSTRKLVLKEIPQKINTDTKIVINCQNHLIEGVSSNEGEGSTTGNIYNEFIESGDFFKIPLTNEPIKLLIEDPAQSGGIGGVEGVTIQYDYYYL